MSNNNNGNDLGNTLARIEQQLQEQNKMLQFIVQKLFVDPNFQLSSALQQPTESLQALSNIISQTLTGSNDMGNDDYNGNNSNQGLDNNNSNSTEVTHSGMIPLQPLRSSTSSLNTSNGEFDSIATKFVSALNELPPEEKLSKMQKFLESVPPQTADRLKEFVEVLEQQTPFPIRGNKRAKTTDENDNNNNST